MTEISGNWTDRNTGQKSADLKPQYNITSQYKSDNINLKECKSGASTWST